MPKKQDKPYTYSDYLTWDDREKWELLNGVAYMQAAPSWQHQKIVAQLGRQFLNYFQNKPCETYLAPFDVRLPENKKSDEESTTVLQPDIVVICDKSKLKDTGYFGVPVLIIEIVSPASSKMDKLYKFNKYEQAGVKEYWIVEPDYKVVSVFRLKSNKKYGRPDNYSEDDTINVKNFADLIIDLRDVFVF
ncbi:MAG: hypothetical protein A2Y25_07225 [Candidatus Melainabacteria bacterium GWF2_37_15]|nr:MAG: hypothetical protein A2Y25_07225 [Candidatus Melainabacteria bacterium GWF2_37_15]